jgi:hypothetical protein
MTVRQAGDGDLPALLDLMRTCHAQSVYRDLPFSDEDAEHLTRALMASEDGAVLTNGTAFIAVAIVPLHFNFAIKQALEIGFYGAGGGEVIAAAKDWARSRGAVRFAIANELTDRHAARTRWLRARGCLPCAVTFEEWL